MKLVFTFSNKSAFLLYALFYEFHSDTVTSEVHTISYEKMLRITWEAYHSVKAVYLIILKLNQKHEKKLLKKNTLYLFQ